MKERQKTTKLHKIEKILKVSHLALVLFLTATTVYAADDPLTK